MAAEIVQKKASLFGETWAALKKSKAVLWKPLLILSVAYAVFCFLMGEYLQNNPMAEHMKQNPQLFKQHPELAKAYMRSGLIGLAIFLPVALVIQSIASYWLTTAYLRFAMVKSQPTYSRANYFYWLKKALWRCIRPLPWVLIPIIGVFFYWRSMLRYSLVTPLAILQHGPELQRSWDMTKGNWWRIFLGLLGLDIVVGLLASLIMLIPLVIGVVLTHTTGQPAYKLAMSSLMQSVVTASLWVTNAVYACSLYRVLLKEQKNTDATPANPVIP